MSAVCGIWRPGPVRGAAAAGEDSALVSAMLTRVAYRGDTSEVKQGPNVTLGIHNWASRDDGEILADRGGLLAHAGSVISPTGNSLQGLRLALETETATADLDGAFAVAWVDNEGARLRLLRDPFGVRSLYYFAAKGAVYFASELKQLLAVPDCSREIDLSAIHKYLTFSFVPGEAVPIAGVKRVLPGHIATFEDASAPKTKAYFVLEEKEQEAFRDRTTAVEALREIAKAAVSHRVTHGEPLALYLSGGLDSSAMAVWLKSRGTDTTLLTLDFGDDRARDHAHQPMARHCWIRGACARSRRVGRPRCRLRLADAGPAAGHREERRVPGTGHPGGALLAASGEPRVQNALGLTYLLDRELLL